MRLSERSLRYQQLYLKLRGGLSYKDYAKRIDEMTYGDPMSMLSRHLARLLDVVQKSNKYYAEILSHGDGLESLPILTKEIIRRHFHDLQSIPMSPTVYRNSSGGSTGQPITLIQDANYTSWSNATQGYYFRELLGVEMNTVKNVWLWGSERDSLHLREHRIRGQIANFLCNKFSSTPSMQMTEDGSSTLRLFGDTVRTTWLATPDLSTRWRVLRANTMCHCIGPYSFIRPPRCLPTS